MLVRAHGYALCTSSDEIDETYKREPPRRLLRDASAESERRLANHTHSIVVAKPAAARLSVKRTGAPSITDADRSAAIRQSPPARSTGAPNTNRTCDLPLRRRLLYPLSYRGLPLF
jgi:hypothetical protein